MHLVVFKVIVGCQGLRGDEAQNTIEALQKHINLSAYPPEYAITHFFVPDWTSEKTDIQLLYPPSNPLLDAKDLLDLMIARGEVPADILAKIKKEIESHNEHRT